MSIVAAVELCIKWESSMYEHRGRSEPLKVSDLDMTQLKLEDDNISLTKLKEIANSIDIPLGVLMVMSDKNWHVKNTFFDEVTELVDMWDYWTDELKDKRPSEEKEKKQSKRYIMVPLCTKNTSQL